MSTDRPTDQLLLDVGARIAAFRRERGYTQAALAQRVGVSDKYLQRVEAGIENLTLRSLWALANVLEVETAALLRSAVPVARTRGRPRKVTQAPPVVHVKPTPAAVSRSAVPMLTLRARAGEIDTYAADNGSDWVEVPGRKTSPGAFVARVFGASSTARIPDGALALFNAASPVPRDGVVALVALDHGARYVLRRVRLLSSARAPVVAARLETLHPAGAHMHVELSEAGPARIVAELADLLSPNSAQPVD